MVDLQLFSNALSPDGTVTLNKLATLTIDVEHLQQKLQGVYEIMTNSDPDDDLDQKTLELFIFEAKSKVKVFKDKLEDLKPGLSELLKMTPSTGINLDFYKDTIRQAGTRFDAAINECTSLIQRISATALKWEMGSSEVLKALKDEIKATRTLVETHSSFITDYLDKLTSTLNTLKDESESHIEEITKVLESFDEKIQTFLTFEEFNTFKTELSNFLSLKASESTKIVKFS
jgi:hypothetical protein